MRNKTDVGYFSEKAARDQIDIFRRGGRPIKPACRAATTAGGAGELLDAYALDVQLGQGSTRAGPRWRRHTYRLLRRWPEPPSAV